MRLFRIGLAAGAWLGQASAWAGLVFPGSEVPGGEPPVFDIGAAASDAGRRSPPVFEAGRSAYLGPPSPLDTPSLEADRFGRAVGAFYRDGPGEAAGGYAVYRVPEPSSLALLAAAGAASGAAALRRRLRGGAPREARQET